MSNRPPLPPVVPGRSALPAFLAVEAWAEARLATARETADARLAAAREAAAAVETQGRERLREAVLEGEAEALRAVEARAVDRVSRARAEVDRWIGASESALEEVVREAVLRLTAPPTRDPAPVGSAEAG